MIQRFKTNIAAHITVEYYFILTGPALLRNTVGESGRSEEVVQLPVRARVHAMEKNSVIKSFPFRCLPSNKYVVEISVTRLADEHNGSRSFLKQLDIYPVRQSFVLIPL